MSADLYLHSVSSEILDLLEQYPGLVDVFRGYYEVLEHPEPLSLLAIQQLQESRSFIQEYYPESPYHFVTPEIFGQVQAFLPQIIEEAQNRSLCLEDMREVCGVPPSLNWFLSGDIGTELCDFLAQYDERQGLYLVNALLGSREIGNVSGHGYMKCLSLPEVQTINQALSILHKTDLSERWTILCQTFSYQSETADVELENLKDSLDEIIEWYEEAVSTEQAIVIYES
jgi:Domain of unknown function (DUF1877)